MDSPCREHATIPSHKHILSAHNLRISLLEEAIKCPKLQGQCLAGYPLQVEGLRTIRRYDTGISGEKLWCAKRPYRIRTSLTYSFFYIAVWKVLWAGHFSSI